MSEIWRSTTLGSLVEFQRGHDLPVQNRKPGSIPVVGSTGTLGYHSEAKYSGPGVLIGRSGVIGGSILVSGPYWPLNTTLFVKDFRGNDPQWLYYLLKTIDFSGYNSGSAQPSLNRNYIAGIELSVPDVPEQRAIAETLGALDGKIQSSQRTRSLLRQLGRAKFQRAVEHDSRTKTLDDLTISIARGVTPKYADGESSAPVVINQKCIRDGWVSLEPARQMQTREVAVAKRAGDGDILVNSTGTGTLGRLARWHKGDIFVDSHVSVVKPDPSEVEPIILAYAMFGRQTDIEGLATGSTGQTELSPARLGSLPVVIPGGVLSGLSRELLAIEEKVEQLAAEVTRLEALRDTLLPELLSGRIDVPVEAIV